MSISFSSTSDCRADIVNSARFRIFCASFFNLLASALASLITPFVAASSISLDTFSTASSIFRHSFTRLSLELWISREMLVSFCFAMMRRDFASLSSLGWFWVISFLRKTKYIIPQTNPHTNPTAHTGKMIGGEYPAKYPSRPCLLTVQIRMYTPRAIMMLERYSPLATLPNFLTRRVFLIVSVMKYMVTKKKKTAAQKSGRRVITMFMADSSGGWWLYKLSLFAI